MRAIDVWVILCYIGMFSALMEYIVILFLTKDSASNDKKDNEERKSSKKKRQMLAKIIERVSQIILPFYNLVFPIIYFMICVL